MTAVHVSGSSPRSMPSIVVFALLKELSVKLIVLSVAVLVSVLVASVVPTQAQTFPASWAGIWEFTTDEEECNSGPFIGTFVDTDTICAGEGFGVEEGVPMQCTGTIDDTTIDVSCSGSLEIFTDCTMTISFAIQGTRTGDSIQGTEQFSITYTGSACGILEDECTDSTISGVRLGPEPPECSTPTIPTTWGAIKAIYR